MNCFTMVAVFMFGLYFGDSHAEHATNHVLVKQVSAMDCQFKGNVYVCNP